MTEPETIGATPNVLLHCLVYWNAVFSVSVLVANLAALIAHLHAWSAHYQRCLILDYPNMINAFYRVTNQVVPKVIVDIKIKIEF